MTSVYIREYGEFLRKEAKFKRTMTVVFDCSNGYAGEILKETFKGVPNIKPIYLNAKPDGNFPGRGPDPSSSGALDGLKKEVVDKKADLGVAYDGDADRAVFIDDDGKEIDADDLIRFYIEETKPKAMVVDLCVGWSVGRGSNIKIFRTKVGNYYIKKAMIENRVDFGAESAGHYYFKIKGVHMDGAIKMTILIIAFLSKRGSISEIINGYPRSYVRMAGKNYFVKNREAVIKAIKKSYARRKSEIMEIDGLTVELKNLWFNIRPSATEDLLRLNIEAKNEAILQKELRMLESLIEKA